MVYRAILLLAAAVVAAGFALKPGLKFGRLTELASPAPPASAEPNLSKSPSGRVYLSWIEQRADSTHALRFSTLRGNRWSSPATVATSTRGSWFVNWADFPSVLAVDDNRLVAHWLVRTGPGKYAYHVNVARSSDGGRSWTAPVTLHSDKSESEHGFVSLFAAGQRVGAAWLDGRKHATATSEAGAEMTLQYAAIDASGKPVSEAQLDGRVCDCCQTAAALTSSGPVIVYRDRSAQEVRDIAIVRLVKGRWTEPRPVHRDNWVINACPVNGPSVSAQGRNVVVAWFTGAHDKPRVYAAFSKDAGATFGSPVRIDDGAPAGRVDAQYIGNGEALISWLERVGQNAEVRVKHIAANGRVSDAKTIASSSGERASGFPHMIHRGNDIVFAWTAPGRPSRVRTASLQLRR
jgi:hypothetical protein